MLFWNDMRDNKTHPLNSEKTSTSEHNPTSSKDGVDLSLIRWMLSMTPTQRLQVLQQNIRAIMRLRGGKPSTWFLEILKVLTKHKVSFIVVGGVCVASHGAPVTTFDLGLVHSRSSQNLASLISALNELDAFYRGRANHQLKPKRSHLSSPGINFLWPTLALLTFSEALEGS